MKSGKRIKKTNSKHVLFESHAILWGTVLILAFLLVFIIIGVLNINDNTLADRGLSAKEETHSPKPQSAKALAPLSNTQNSPLPYVALTFDDGPYAPTTKKILKALNKRGVHATFFSIGYRVEINKHLVQQMSNDGHEFGIHSWDHPNYTKLNRIQIRQQQEKCASIIEEYTGQQPRLSRPPYGGNDDKTDKACGTPIILWSLDSLDWKETNRKKLVKRVLSQAQAGDIILMHDLQKITAECIDEILDGLIRKGLTPVTVSNLFAAYDGTTVKNGFVYYSVDNKKATTRQVNK